MTMTIHPRRFQKKKKKIYPVFSSFSPFLFFHSLSKKGSAKCMLATYAPLSNPYGTNFSFRSGKGVTT